MCPPCLMCLLASCRCHTTGTSETINTTDYVRATHPHTHTHIHMLIDNTSVHMHTLSQFAYHQSWFTGLQIRQCLG